MKTIVLVLLVVAVSCQAFKREFDEDWKKFKETYNKQYHRHEESRRRVAFETNAEKIAKHNREYDLGIHSYRLGLNQYADLTNKEFRHLMNGFRMKSRSNGDLFISTLKDLPDTVDWRTKKIVTEVKNQQQCGSCWAFSTTGSLEGQHALATGKLVSLSEQNLVDCSGPEGNLGCDGGLMDQGFEYIIKNGGIDTEESYPYTAQDGTCQFNKANVGATVKSYKDIPSGDENSLQQAVATIGPISVAIDASQDDFQLYSDGVYDNEDCSSIFLDHGVLAVGYGTENGKDYWLVKNSWGGDWGSQGYIKMSRNKSNQCGIATQASYPIV